MSGVSTTLTTLGNVTGTTLGSVASTIAASQTTGIPHSALAFTGFALGGYALLVAGLAVLGVVLKVFNR
ncbi:MAG: hypothetical protein M0019_04360 [Actinomycetota bacterium]|nr:hypothetical protein [Actinomycetota bacterium]